MNRSWLARIGALALAAGGSMLSARESATPRTLDRASRPPQSPPAVARAPTGSDAFDEKELAKILQLSPLRDPPPDPTNAHADDRNAATLGRWLFFDKRISKNGELACASCHDPARAFSDDRALAQGLRTTDRNTPALWNAAWQRWYFWDGRADSLWAQALQPIENELELGGNRAAIAHLIRSDVGLRTAYEAIFGALPDLADAQRFPQAARPLPARGDDGLAQAWSSMQEKDRDALNRVFANIGKALEAYVRKIQSRHSEFDRFVAALRANDARGAAEYPAAARRGLALFVGKANCHSCHAGPNFSDNEFHNVGVPARDLSSRAGDASVTVGKLGATLGDLSAPGREVNATPRDVNAPPRDASAPPRDLNAPSRDLNAPSRDASASSLVDAGRRAGIERAMKDPFNAAGIYSDDREGAHANELATLVRSSESFGQFKTPSLRNVALSAPYMHQGQFATLADVLHHYSTLEGAVPAGHHGEQVLRPLHLTQEESDDIIAFLQTLTDIELPRELFTPPKSPLSTAERASSR